MAEETPKSGQAPESGPADASLCGVQPDRKVCFCHNVQLSEILAAIQQGAATIGDIQSKTCASTGCGGCEYEVLDILEQELSKTSGESPAD